MRARRSGGDPRSRFAPLLLLAALLIVPDGVGAQPAIDSTPDDPSALIQPIQRAIERQAAWWFPRSIDTERGGFFETYDLQGQPQPDNLRTLVFQCRQTWVAASLAQALPEQAPRLREHVAHGLRFLRSHFADPEHGGLFWARTFDGSAAPRVGDQKHAYALSFAIYAGVAAEDAAPGSGGLQLAQETFAWLEEHAYDPVHGGYLEAFTRDGRPILEPITGPNGPSRFDALGTLFGRKSMNTHIHLLEAFAALYRVWPDPVLRERLLELDGIVRRRIFADPGCLHLFFTRDWKPLPDASSFGHDVETAHLLIESARRLGFDDERARIEPKRLVDHALDYGWDAEHGGFFDTGSAFGKARVEPKTWWVEAEALHALALMHTLYPEEPIYGQRLVEQWRFIERSQIDPADGAWYAAVSPDGAEAVRPIKAHRWKAGYHTVRSLIETLRLLREGPAHVHAEAPAPEPPRPWTAMPAQAPNPGLFRFAVISDNSTGARPGVFPEAVRKLNLLQPDFVMSVGDFIEGFGADAGELDRQWARIQNAIAHLTPPFFYVPGNHDVAHPVMMNAWLNRFGVDRYHFVHRGVLMLCLNAQEIFPEGIAEPQIDYVERVLRDHADARWTFVFLHKPLWRKPKTGWQRIEAALGDRPYTVFAGHTHNYKHEVRNGHDYFVLSVTGGKNLLRGVEKGDFDHVMWVTMGDAPQYANILLDGVYDKALTQPGVAPLYSALQNEATVLVEPRHASSAQADHVTLHVTNPADATLRIVGETLAGEETHPFDETIGPAARATFRIPVDSVGELGDDPLRVRYELSYAVDGPGVLPVREPAVTLNLAAEPLREIPAASAPVIVDGTLDEWNDLPWMVGPSPGADGAATFALATDAQNLYVAIRVNDDVLVGKAHDRPWGQDGVELRLDARQPLVRANGRGRNDAKQSDHLLIGLGIGDDPAKPPRPFLADQLPEGIVTALHRNERGRSGYAIEIAVPHEVLDRYRGGPWDGLRLNLAIDDLDTADGRPAQHWWQPDWRGAANVIGAGSFVRGDAP